MNLRLTAAMLNFKNDANEMLCYPGFHGSAIEVATIAQHLTFFCSDHRDPNDRSDRMETNLYL